jgi:cell division protein FtsB
MPDEPAPKKEQEPAPAAPSAQDRINRLTRQKHDANREVEALRAENAQLAEKITSFDAQFAALRNPPPASPPASPFGLPQEPQQVAAAGVIDDAKLARMVEQAVAGAIAPVTDMINANARGTAQQRAFSELAREEPALADPNSDLHKAFSQIWDNRPDIQRLDDGIELAVRAAQGAVGSTPSIPKDAQKTAASVTPPRTSPQNLLPTEGSDAAKAKELAVKLEEKGSKEGLSDGEMEAYLGASLGALTQE